MMQTWGHCFIRPKHLRRTWKMKIVGPKWFSCGFEPRPNQLDFVPIHWVLWHPLLELPAFEKCHPCESASNSSRPSTDVSNRCRRGKNASPQGIQEISSLTLWLGWFWGQAWNHFSHLPNPVVRVQKSLQSKCFLHNRVGYSMLFSFPASTLSQRGLYAAKRINKLTEHCTCSNAKMSIKRFSHSLWNICPLQCQPLTYVWFMCRHVSIDCEGLDENWSISIQLIRSDIVTTDAWVAWMKWYWAPPWDVENHGNHGNHYLLTGDNWRRISSINSIKRACNWDTEPKLSPMPSWFRKWRQRMYSVSSIPKDLKAERRTLEFRIMQLVAGQWFSPRRIKTTQIPSKYLIAWSSIHQQQNESKRYFGSFVWLWHVFTPCACSVPQISSVMVSSKVNSLGDPLLIGLEPDPWETSASETFCQGSQALGFFMLFLQPSWHIDVLWLI